MAIRIRMCKRHVYSFILLIFSLQNVTTLQDDNEKTELTDICPKMLHRVFYQSAPTGDTKSGNFTQYKDIIDIKTCVKNCCVQKSNCNIAFIFEEICYHVKCLNNELCLPKKRKVKGQLQMVLVNPVLEYNSNTESTTSITWTDILKASNIEDFLPTTEIDPEKINFWKQQHKFRFNNEPTNYDDDQQLPIVTEKRLNSLLNQKFNGNSNTNNGYDRFSSDQQFLPDDNMGSTLNDPSTYLGSTNLIACDLSSLEQICPFNEECISIIPESREGVCRCLDGYKRNKLGKCIKITDMDFAADTIVEKLFNDNNNLQPVGADLPIVETTTKTPLKKIQVSVDSKVVQLPEKEVTLVAFTIPDEQTSGDTYRYSWTLVTQPSGPVNGTITDQAKDKVKLSNLSEGLYTFKITVNGTGSYGETMVNVTVLPQKRINKFPEAIITPKEQTIKPPNSKAILDGSTSIDDDKIISWHWELIQGPIGYQPVLPDTSTLQLTDLEIPGNYTFKLTVTDSDKTQNSTTSNIIVQKITDYPPEANAGPDVILYLPHNNVTLNGTLSTDDREINAWEWTNDSNKGGKAVDMQNTRTPYLQLSNLEEGFYTFVLKVTDISNQSSSAKVNVFVKPPSNLPPVANAGLNMTINLPRTWIILNGSQSTDVIHIKQYYWVQISGPNKAIIANSNASIANATALTVGKYVFELTVTDENKNTGKAQTVVTVVQEKNYPPVADAGGDQTIKLPISAIYLNGSKSSDDLRIVKYLWTRDDSSLAYGNIVGETDHEPILILTDLVPGHYSFKLTVFDNQGLSNSQSVNILVNQDSLIMNLVELTLSLDITSLTKTEYETIVQKIALIIGDVKVHVRELKKDSRSGEAILVFYVEKTNSNGKAHIVPGVDVEKILKDKFFRDESLLGTPFTDARTTICQNKCSGHGNCNTITRACVCETFWMPSIFYYWSVDDANCDWSVLYVVVGVFVGFLLLSGIFWGISCVFRRRRSKKPRTRPKKLTKYALLGTQEDELPSFARGTSLTDSDTDSDVLFENRSKQNGILRLNGTNKNGPKYSKTRLGRKMRA